MTHNAGDSSRGLPVAVEHEVGHAVDGQRWNGLTWEPAGAEGIASATAPNQGDEGHAAE